MEEREIERLFREHYLDMYKLAQRYLYDKEECKDIVSDVFANLVHQQTRMIPEIMRQYLMMSVRNRCINAINQKIRLHFEWTQELTLQQNITLLNSFNHINISLENNKIIVE